jgi:hypothetical protein
VEPETPKVRLLTLSLSPIVGWERFNRRLPVVGASAGVLPKDGVQSLTSLTEVEQDVMHAAFGHSVNNLVRCYPTPGDRSMNRRRRPEEADRMLNG